MEHEFQLLQLVLSVIKILERKYPNKTIEFALYSDGSGKFGYYVNVDEYIELEVFNNIRDLQYILAKYFKM